MEIINDREKFIKNRANESFFIEAGAGAGKSTTMVDKIVDNILSGISPERIVTITFTNKSAEDLLIRVTNRIDAARNKAIGQDKIRLNNAFYSLYKMKISTIHSFCYKIISEYSFDAHIPFGTKLIVEEEVEEIATNLYNRWYQTLPAEDLSFISNMNRVTGGNTFIKSTGDKILATYQTLYNKYFPDMTIVDVVKIDIQKCYDFLVDIANFLDQHLKADFVLTSTVETIRNDEIIPFFKKYPQCIKEKDPAFFDFYFALAMLLKRLNCAKVFKKGKIVTDPTQGNEDYAKLIIPLSEILDNLSIYFLKDCNKYASQAYQYYLDNRDNGVITNNELVYKTYELIKNEPNARANIASQYDVIYVDEFQDTDNYQIELIKLLALEIDKRKNPSSVGSLIVVGDPKQSIYRFRGADFNSYMNFKQIYASLTEPNKTLYSVVSLPDNFRSSSIILDWVNDTYSKMNFYAGYTYTPMLYPSNHLLLNDWKLDIKRLAGVYMHNLHDGEDYSKTAEMVDFLVTNGYEIMETADKTDRHSPYAWRKIKYSDFMIIFASKTHLNACSKAFAKRGIPYDITGKLEVSSIKGIRELVRIINYILIPDVDNRKTAIEILSHRYKDIASTEVALDALMTTVKNMSNYGKVYYVFNHYDEYVGDMDAIDTKGIQASIFQILESLFQKDNMSAVDIMNTMFDMITEYQKTALAIERDSDAVQIMNAHQTKGLEANIVIYITASETNGANACEVINNTLYLNCLPQNPLIKQECEKQILEECLRKEYVISTRARQMIIFDEDLLSARDTRLYHIDQYPYDWTNLTKYHTNDIPDDITTPIIVSGGSKFTKNKKGPISHLSTPIYLETTPSKLEQRKNPLPDDQAQRIANNVHRPMNNVFGTMLHRCNELYVRNPLQNLDEIVDIAMKENDCADDCYRTYLRKCLFATRDLFAANDMLSATLEPEYKFYYFITNNQTPILMNGSIDLLMIKDNLVTIIDFKSDAADYQNKEQFEQVLKENYQPQLEAYRDFCSKIYPNHQIEMKIIWYEEINDMTTARILDLTK